MRAVIINRHRKDFLGGSEIQCDIIGRGLVKRGHEVSYIAVDGKDSYADHPYKVVPVSQQGEAIVRTCLTEKPDIVYWRFGKICFRYVAKRVRQSGVPFVFAISSNQDITALPPWERIKRYSGVWGASRRIATSLWNHRGFKWVSGLASLNPDYVGILQNPSQVFIPNSMPVEQTPFAWPRPYVAWVANIKSLKRPEICVELARALESRGVDVLMVGKIQQQRYQWFGQPHLLPSNLHYLGPKTVEEVNGVLSGALALVHTCIPEGFGNNFIQAWLQSKPTISLEFDPGGLITKHGFGYVANGDRGRFYRYVIRIVEDPVGAHEMGSRAQAWATCHCQSEQNVDRLIAYLQGIIETSNQEPLAERT